MVAAVAPANNVAKRDIFPHVSLIAGRTDRWQLAHLAERFLAIKTLATRDPQRPRWSG